MTGTIIAIVILLGVTALLILSKPRWKCRWKMSNSMNEETRETLREIEAHSRFPTGIGRIDRGECPLGAVGPIWCTFCSYGHILCCHFPYSCEEAECSHYQQEMEAEFGPDIYPEEEP